MLDAAAAARHPAGAREQQWVCRIRSRPVKRDLDQAQTALLGEGAGVLTRSLAVVADAEPDVQPVGLVAELDQDVPHGQAVLAARHCHQHLVVGREHLEMLDRLDHLAPAQLQEVLGAEVGVVSGQVDDRRSAAGAALRTGGDHQTPPEITGRISTVSSAAEVGVARYEGAVADDEVRFA